MDKQATGERKSSLTKVNKNGNNAKACKIVLGCIFVMILLLFIIYFVLQRIGLVKPTPESLLEKYTNSYQYFFSDAKITEYYYDSDFQYSNIHIKTSIAPDKISELLETKILKDCEQERFTCIEPIWHTPAEYEYYSFDTGIVERPIVSEYEYCSSAIYIDLRENICIDTDTGNLIFDRMRW